MTSSTNPPEPRTTEEWVRLDMQSLWLAERDCREARRRLEELHRVRDDLVHQALADGWAQAQIAEATDPSRGRIRHPGIYHRDGPLAQVRQMAEWTEGLSHSGSATQCETLRKITANLRAAADALELDDA